MIYRIFRYDSGREVLREFDDFHLIDDFGLRDVSAEDAHQWVKAGKEHETGLFIDDDGNMQYAEAEG